MTDILTTGAVVFVAVLIGGWILQFFMKRGNPEDATAHGVALDKLRDENTQLQRELSTANAHLENAHGENRRVSEAEQNYRTKFEQLTSEYNDLKIREGTAIESVKARDQKLKELREDSDRMSLEFKKIADEILKGHGEAFKEQNKQQIDNILSPLKTKIDEFKVGVTNAHETSLAQHAALAQHIKNLNERSVELSQETESLTKALKGDVQLQGAWGQHILENILQHSGLREGQEYSREETHVDEDGGRVRTDVIVMLPNGDRIILDAKVSVKDFELAMKAETIEERSRHLASHTASVKKHINILAGKDYHKKADSRLDFVIMFMPIESALGAAFQHDDKIGYFAAENNVAIATPTTLMAVLKTIASIWRVERQNKNAEDIAKRSGALYDKFCGFLADLENIGVAIGKADGAYKEACKKLSTGQGNLVRQTKQLEELGAKVTKTIPDNWIEDDVYPLIETTENQKKTAV